MIEAEKHDTNVVWQMRGQSIIVGEVNRIYTNVVWQVMDQNDHCANEASQRRKTKKLLKLKVTSHSFHEWVC